MISTLFGLSLAGTGVAHFVAPQAFEAITRAAFPDDTDTWIQRNGATETVVGLLLVSERTRSLGRLGLLAYVGFLTSRVAGRR